MYEFHFYHLMDKTDMYYYFLSMMTIFDQNIKFIRYIRNTANMAEN